MASRRLGFLSLAVDMAMVVASPWVVATLKEGFRQQQVHNAIWPGLAFLGYCWVIDLVRRLPHDEDALPDGSSQPTKRSQWAFLSIMLGTITFLFMAPLVAGGAEMDEQGPFVTLVRWYEKSSLAQAAAIPLSIIVLIVIFAPFYLYLRNPPATIDPKRVLGAEVAVLVVTDLIALVGVALFEWGFEFAGVAVANSAHPVSLAAMALVVPPFLFIYGGPRILLLARRFSWMALLSLIVSTWWYLAYDVAVSVVG